MKPRTVINIREGQRIIINQQRYTVTKIYPFFVKARRQNNIGYDNVCINLGELVENGYETKRPSYFLEKGDL